MKIKSLDIEGVFIVYGFKYYDKRGWFWKTYQDNIFSQLNIDFNCRETFISKSKKGVIRGMHFQSPPYAQSKLVTCFQGSVTDVLLDLRKKSKTFGKSISINLSGNSDVSLFIPIGIAHGFCTLSTEAIMLYQVSRIYNSNSDTGILWNSFGFKWPYELSPIVSSRDKKFTKFREFISPF